METFSTLNLEVVSSNPAECNRVVFFFKLQIEALCIIRNEHILRVGAPNCSTR